MGYPTFGTTIEEMTIEVRMVNIDKGWRSAAGGPGTNTFGDYIALLHSEVSEALEAYRDHRLADATKRPRCSYSPCEAFGEYVGPGLGCVDPRHTADTPPKPEGVGSELADVLIRLLDMADVFGIDLEAEYRRKIAYNRGREFQHGGRTLAGEKETDHAQA